jgi:hypothetical protein
MCSDIRDGKNHYNVELRGVIEFDVPRSLNWHNHNISAIANSSVLLADQNQWVEDFEENMHFIIEFTTIKLRMEILLIIK